MKKEKKQVPIETLELFPVLDKMLNRFLRSLNDSDWNSPTIAKRWKVKDIAAHLLDGNLRTLSFSRDGYFGQSSPEINSYTDLVNYLNQLNHAWTDAAQRLSPAVITDLLEHTGKQFCKHIKQLDPYDDAVFSVAWAGQEISPNWFHIAREYTEKFLHQQQIRDAFGNKELLTKKLYRPFLDTFMQALPFTFRNTMAAEGTIVSVIVPGKAGGKWHITRKETDWKFIKKPITCATAVVAIDADDAWKLFSKGMSPELALDKVKMSGNIDLCKTALNMISVMA